MTKALKKLFAYQLKPGDRIEVTGFGIVIVADVIIAEKTYGEKSWRYEITFRDGGNGNYGWKTEFSYLGKA